ncbi:MAG: hypothetical protein ABIF10_01545 [Candidatus Woesearchaeota archaeon]
MKSIFTLTRDFFENDLRTRANILEILKAEGIPIGQEVILAGNPEGDLKNADKTKTKVSKLQPTN